MLKFFCKSCSVFCETSLLVKFSPIVFRNAEKAAIFFLTFVCLDDSTGDVLCVFVLSSIDE